MITLVDGDILRYEIGFSADAGWRNLVEDPFEVPPFEYVHQLLDIKLEQLKHYTGADRLEIYLSEGPSFRHEIAKRVPYKSSRHDNRPWHYNNLSAVLYGMYGAHRVEGLEADDALALAHLHSEEESTLCSRDKDLRQVPGRFYSWELGAQPSWGPDLITPEGELEYDDKRRVLKGTGYSFFMAQCLMGDPADTIPGIRNCGPAKTFAVLKDARTPEEQFDAVCSVYTETYGKSEWEAELLEQGRLLWMTRRLHSDGSPVLWELGMYE